MTTSSDPRALSLAYLEAVGEKRFDRVAELLHPDFELHMPGRTLRGADQYIDALRRLGPILLRNDVITAVVDGGDVCIVYDFVTDTAVGRVRSVEWITVDAGRIRAIRLIFHKEHWPAVLGELIRRAAVGAGQG